MAIVKSDLVQALFTAWKADFQGGLDGADSSFEQICTTITSTTKSNTYGWLGKFPTLREWIGDRVINSMQEHGYTIENKKYESTVGVEVTDIEDDNLGIYAPIFAEMGRAVKAQVDQLSFGLLASGETNLCYDKLPFFSKDHKVFNNAGGKGTSKKVSNIDEPSSNPQTPWYLLDATRSIKPIIYQTRRAPELIVMDKVDDEVRFTKDQIRFGVDCRRNVGYSFWQLAYMSKQELMADSLWAAISKMREISADGGQKLGIKPSVLVVPPSLEKQATRMLEREIDGNSSNELKGRLKLLVADYL